MGRMAIILSGIVTQLLFANIASIAAAEVPFPECQDAAPEQYLLHVPSTNVTIPQSPVDLTYLNDSVAFLALGLSLGVLDMSATLPTLLHQYELPSELLQTRPPPSAAGEIALSNDKKRLYVPVGSGAVAYDVDKLLANDTEPKLQLLTTDGITSVKALVSADDDYLFLSKEVGIHPEGGINFGCVDVFNLETGTHVGSIFLGYAVVGMALSSDGSRLYVTSEMIPEPPKPILENPGTLSVLDVETLKTKPEDSLISSVNAGCQPVRVLVSPDGSLVWVTLRKSNHLVAFDADKLETDPENAIVSSIQVGTAPVGFEIIDDGNYIVTADSNRHALSNATSGLTVVNVKQALSGKQLQFSRLDTGLFPRSFGLSPDGKKLMVSQFDSLALQQFHVDDIVGAAAPYDKKFGK